MLNENNGNKSIVFGLTLGLCLIISALIIANTLFKIKAADNTLAVTGSAKKTVSSDLGKITGSFTRTVPVTNLRSGYDQMASDLKIVKNFFKGKGIAEKDLTISPIFMDQQYQYNKTDQTPAEYNLRQTVELQLKDVKKITEIAKEIQDLIKDNVLFSVQPVEYYYTDLAKIRVDLLGDAVKDAKDRAGKIAASNDQEVGSLKSASVGVTQVTSVNSVDSISDYGAYDTSKVEKEVMITVKAVFGLK